VVARYLEDGTLDASFATAGVYTRDFGNADDHAAAIALESDGKIVVAGKGGADFTVVRLDASGAPDTTFGPEGTRSVDVYGDDLATDVAVDSGGKILVGGHVGVSNLNFGLARFTATGSIDLSFGLGSGKMQDDFTSGGSDELEGLAIDSTGRILAGGLGNPPGLASDNFLAARRYAPNGDVDTSFGTMSGTAIGYTGGPGLAACDLALQGDGKILVNECTGIVSRFLAGGALDTGFASGGHYYSDFTIDNKYVLKILPVAGGVVLVGSVLAGSNFDFLIVRLTDAGALDTSFGGAGWVNTAIGASSEQADSAGVDSVGRYVLAGWTHDDTNARWVFALARYWP
jgi:uncharacterized delta-60 repeat protein